jgi:hypothetical protein
MTEYVVRYNKSKRLVARGSSEMNARRSVLALPFVKVLNSIKKKALHVK